MTPAALHDGSLPSAQHTPFNYWIILFPLSVIGLTLALAALVIPILSNLNGPLTTLSSDPAGATVLINGTLAGMTPLTLAGLPSGQYSLRLEKNGFQPAIQTLQVPSPNNAQHLKLQSCGTARLSVNIQPVGAEVLLDNEFVGHVPLRDLSISVGKHDLIVRKTNFKSYTQRLEASEGQFLEFAGFALEDAIFTMLKSAIESEKTRVSHYMDLGHYLFANDRLDESADQYCMALRVAAQPLAFPTGTTPEEVTLEKALRGEDVSHLNEEIRHKTHWPIPKKGLDAFKAKVLAQQEASALANVGDWVWVENQAMNYLNNAQFAMAAKLYQKHLEEAPYDRADQAHIGLLNMQLRLHSLPAARETYARFSARFGTDPSLARQAANTIYSLHAEFHNQEEAEVLEWAEKLLSQSVAVAFKREGNSELTALCKFELANVLMLQKHPDLALQPYRDSVLGTHEPTTKELRLQRLCECLRLQGQADELRECLLKLQASPREAIQQKARMDLSNLNKK